MIHRPQFKAHFHIETVSGEGVFLISERGYAVLTGHFFELVAPLIDGRRSADDIVEKLQAQASPAEVYYALMLLEEKGYIVEGGHAFPPGEAAVWAVQGIDPAAAARRLAETKTSVTALGNVAAKPFLALLKSLRVRVGKKEAGLGIVLTDNYLRRELEAYNRDALRGGRPWVLIKPVGSEIWVGPVFRPGETGCWECMARRLRINRAVEMFAQRRQERDEPFPVPAAVTSATSQLAYSLAATVIAKWIAGGETPKLEGNVLSLSLLSLQTQFHELVRQPLCPACGDGAAPAREQPAGPLVLESRLKTFTEDGGHRAVAPEETLRKYERHVSPITGAVSVLQHYSPANDGVMHVYIAGENHAAPHHNLKQLQKSLRTRSSGKGTTDIQARASGLCEALERYSGVFQGTEPRRKARLKELDGLGIHPNDCMRYSRRQYRQRDAINAKGERFNIVPLPFDEEAEVEWTPVWSLRDKLYRYLPTEYCYYSYARPQDRRFCLSCSNGSAAGNTLEEAILQGFLELVERDGVALWWYNRVPRPGVDLDSFDEPYLIRLRTFLRGIQRELWVLDVTSDLGIPVFAAFSRRTDHPQEQIMFGFGAHFDPRIALLRAVTEANQMLMWLIPDYSDAGEVSQTVEDPDVISWAKTATVANQPYLAAAAGVPPRVASDYPQRWTDDLKDDVRFCQELVERHGMEMLVLDQTRPDIGLPVVKVFVPGLRHFWPRFAPGRLYDVPVTLGWLSEPRTEKQLNPVSMFL